MADYKVVGIGLRDVWDYDYVRKWMDREKQIAAVEEALKCECDFELPRFRYNLGCDIDEILGLNRVTQDRVYIQYDKKTLNYLLNKPLEVLEKLTEVVVSGIQEGLEETLLKQELAKRRLKEIGHLLFDNGNVDLDEMQKSIRKALNNDKELKYWFTEKQRNHMVHYFGNKYAAKIVFD